MSDDIIGGQFSGDPNHFAYALTAALTAHSPPDANVWLSPFSVLAVLYMLATGVGKQTGEELLNLMLPANQTDAPDRWSGRPDENQRLAKISALLRSLLRTTSGGTPGRSSTTISGPTLHFAAGFFAKAEVVFRQEYCTNVRATLDVTDGPINDHDRTPLSVSGGPATDVRLPCSSEIGGGGRALFKVLKPGDAGSINNWVNQQTQGMVPEIVTPQIVDDPLVKALLLSVVAFEGQWAAKFEYGGEHAVRFASTSMPMGGGTSTSTSSFPMVRLKGRKEFVRYREGEVGGAKVKVLRVEYASGQQEVVRGRDKKPAVSGVHRFPPSAEGKPPRFEAVFLLRTEENDGHQKRTSSVSVFPALHDPTRRAELMALLSDDVKDAKNGATAWIPGTVVNVLLPRFEVESDLYELKEEFLQAHAPRIFAFETSELHHMFDRADGVPGDLEHELKVDKVLHKAKVEVTEHGTKAAAATAAVIMARSLPPPPQHQFVVDRPFDFLIRSLVSGAEDAPDTAEGGTDTEGGGVVLFAGHVADPKPLYFEGGTAGGRRAAGGHQQRGSSEEL